MMHSLEKARQEKLLRRAQRGDADAFEALVAPYEQKIYALCFRLMAQREDAQDAAQETMIRIYRSLGDYRGDAQLGTFIYRVATNACMDALRKRRVRAGESLEALSEEGFVPADRAPGPEETLLRSERGEAISKAIQALSDVQATIEEYERTLQRWDAQVQLATVSVTLVETRSEDAAREGELGLIARVGNALAESARGLGAFLQGALVFAIAALPWAALAAAVGLLVYRIFKRRRTPRK